MPQMKCQSADPPLIRWKGAVLSVLLIGSTLANAQDQTQQVIAKRIVQAFPDTQIVPCPTQYTQSLKLGKSTKASACLTRPKVRPNCSTTFASGLKRT